MKNKKFNKFGGTEFRTSNPLNDYYSILSWINKKLSNNKNNDFNWDEEFKSYVKMEKIYTYKKDDKIKKRFNFILGHLEKWGFLKINNQDKKIELLIDLKEYENSSVSIEELFFKQMYLNWPIFNELIKFIEHQFVFCEKIEISKICWAFAVYEQNDSFDFSSLYSMNKEEILKHISGSFKKNELNINKLYKKKISEFYLFDEIFNLINTKSQMDEETLLRLSPKDKNNNFKYKYTKMLLNIEPREKVNYLERINKYIENKNGSTEAFLEDLKLASIKVNIDLEYKEMFINWLTKLKIIANRRDEYIYKENLNRNIELNKLKKINKENLFSLKLYISENNIVSEFPFTLKAVKNILCNIQNKNFETIKKNNTKLKNISNATLAEYFVNLYFGHILKLSTQEFYASSHTIMDYNLYPSSPAVGGVPDFDWFDEKQNLQYVAETTILNSMTEIIKQESYPISNHSRTVIGYKNNSKIKLFFINFFNFDNFKKNNDIDKVFTAIFNALLKEIKNKEFIKLKFNELSEFENI